MRTLRLSMAFEKGRPAPLPASLPPKLETLALGSCALEVIPEAVYGLASLRTLALNDNPLPWNRDAIARLRGLAKLEKLSVFRSGLEPHADELRELLPGVLIDEAGPAGSASQAARPTALHR